MKNRPRVTVVLLSSGDQPALHRSLESLSRQSLCRTEFDVLLVRSGSGKTQYKFKPDLLANSDFVLSELLLDNFGDRGRADLVLSEIQGVFVTFLWEGHFLSTHFLESMLNAVEENVVPIAQIVAMTENNEPDFHNSYNQMVLDRTDPPHIAAFKYAELLIEPGKLFPRHWVSSGQIEYAIRNDWELSGVLLALEQEFLLSRVPASVGATYYRGETHNPGPHARTDVTSVQRAWNVLKELQRLDRSKLAGYQKQVLTAVESYFAQVVQNSWDTASHSTAFQALADSGMRGLPWEVLNEPVTTLAIIGNFAPYAGTAGIVAGKRIIENGQRVDVISAVMKSRVKHEENLLLTEPYVRHHKILEPGISGDNDVQIREFIDGGLNTLEDWKALGAKYTNVYSRSMIPQSHILAAAVKRRNPELKWIAEFSDPNSFNVVGQSRPVVFEGRSVTQEFEGMGSDDEQQLLFEDLRLYRWAELLPYFFADKLVFTNENQFEIMLEHAPRAYRHAITRKAVISHHPTLPIAYYQIFQPEHIIQSEKIKLAYFGNFYETRGLTETIDALEFLSDEELRRISLIIFTDSRKERIHAQLPKRVSRILHVTPRLDFLRFLSTISRVDCLIVNDAFTSDYFRINPYLPSKFSDYRGSATPIWSIVEPGSVLSGMKVAYQSVLGDTAGALKVLREILATATSNHDHVS